jgi:hypothetical protein
MKSYKDVLEANKIIPMPPNSLKRGDRVTISKNAATWDLPSAKQDLVKKVLTQSTDNSAVIMDFSGKREIIISNDNGLTRAVVLTHSIVLPNEKTSGR